MPGVRHPTLRFGRSLRRNRTYQTLRYASRLGTLHDEPDTADNILCLSPNHHVLFDYGGFTVNQDLSLTREEGTPTSTLSIDPTKSIFTTDKTTTEAD